MSLSPFYSQGLNSLQMTIIIDSSIDYLSPLFYRQKPTRTPEWETNYPDIVTFLGQFFGDRARSGSFFVTETSYRDLALRCAEMIFNPEW